LLKGDDGSLLLPHQATKLSDRDLKTVLHLQKNHLDLAHFPQNKRFIPASSGIAALGYQYVLFLMHTGDVIGVLLLGGKLSGAPFSIRDHQLLETLSSYAGTAIANLGLTQKLLDTEKRGLAADMAGGIAHEINNALSPLMGQAQLIERSLLRSPDTEEKLEMTQRTNMIVEMCNRIKRIALNLGKISEPLRLERTSMSLNDVVEETLKIMSETAGRIKRYQINDSQAKFQLKKSLDEELPPITADRQQISQVFMNLILNACDAMEPQGQGILTVGTYFAREQNVVVGYIEDTGPGIPRSLQDKIYQPYFTTKEEGKGTGLGLPIVRSIIEAHGGQLKIHSTEGHGARIEFTLPHPNQISD
jgi:signal transduction histidine kinase